MVNKVTLIGNLGKDPEIRRFENGSIVAKFSVATNENYRDKSGEWQQSTEWHDVVLWRGMAERAENTLKKGMMVYIEGKLTHRTWQDQDGNNRKTTEVVANYFRSLEKKGGSSGMSGTSGYFPGPNDESTTTNSSNYDDTPSYIPSEAPSIQEGEGGVGSDPNNDVNDDLPF